MSKKAEKNEEIISMFLGLAVVVIVIFFIFKFIENRKGNISLPGVTQENIAEESKDNGEEGTYEVKKGDSLWKIAQNSYQDPYKWVLIAKQNKLENPGLIEVGQKLVVPTLTMEQKQTEEIPAEYKVMAGDSLWKISEAVYEDGYQWVKIWELNRKAISDPNKIEIGMVLRLR